VAALKNTDRCRPNANPAVWILIRVIMCFTIAFNYRILYDAISTYAQKVTWVTSVWTLNFRLSERRSHPRCPSPEGWPGWVLCEDGMLCSYNRLLAVIVFVTWWCPAAGKVTVGLASHWPCVTDFSGLSSYGLTAWTGRWAVSRHWADSRNRPTATGEKKKSLLYFGCDFSGW